MARSSHPNKEVEDALADAEDNGWRFRKMGHWGRIFCPQADREGCQFGVNGTPKNAENHAKQLRRAVERCPHQEANEDKQDGDV